MGRFKKEQKERSDEKTGAQAVIEYVLVLLMLAIAMTLMLKIVGHWSSNVFGKISSTLTNGGDNRGGGR